jgi:hypothetical protein
VVRSPPANDPLQRVPEIMVLSIDVNAKRSTCTTGPGAALHDLCTTKRPVFTRIRDIAHPNQFRARSEQSISEGCAIRTGCFPAGMHVVPSPLVKMPNSPGRLNRMLAIPMTKEP